MPHITVEYSANLESQVDMGEFCQTLNRAAAATGLFPLAGIRARALKCNHYAIADLDPDNGFVDISIRLRAGRSLDARRKATEDIFTAALSFLEPLLERIPLALSMEMRDIDPELSPKTGSIRKFMNLAEGT